MRLERSVLVNALLIGAALGSVFLAVALRDRPGSVESEARARHLLAGLSRADLASIAIRRGAERVTLRRAGSEDPDGFLLEGSPGGRTDPEAVARLVRGLELASFLRRFEREALESKAFGLEPPAAEIALDLGRRGKTRIRVGKSATVPQGATYVAVEEAGRPLAVGLVASDALADILPSRDDLRARELTDLGLADLAEIDVRTPTGEMRLRRGAGPAWLAPDRQLVPHTRRIPRARVEAFVVELGGARASRFLDAATTRAGQAAATVRQVSLLGREKAGRVELEFGGVCPGQPELEVAVRRSPSPVELCLGPGVGRALLALITAGTDLAPFALRGDEIETLIIAEKDKKLELGRSERAFELRAPTERDVDLATGNLRLEALVAARGELVQEADLGKLGLAPPAGSVRLLSSAIEGSERFEETLELGAKLADGKLAVRRPEDGVVLLLPKDTARAFRVDATLFKSTKIFDFSPSELTELRVSWEDERQVLHGATGGGFELRDPPGLAIDGALALELVQAVATLTAERWVSDADDGGFGLTRPTALLELALAPRHGQPSWSRLRVGAECPGGYFAAVDADPGVFVVGKALVLTATTLVVSRAPFVVPVDELERLSLESQGRRLTFERDGKALRPAAGTNLDPTLAERVIADAADLRPEAAVRAGAALPHHGFDKPTLIVRFEAVSGRGAPKTLRVGAGDSWRDERIFYARIDGTNATYALPQSAVRRLLAAF